MIDQQHGWHVVFMYFVTEPLLSWSSLHFSHFAFVTHSVECKNEISGSGDIETGERRNGQVDAWPFRGKGIWLAPDALTASGEAIRL
jgi:hypothetical protein